MDTNCSTRISRRQALAGTAAALAGFKFPTPAIAQGATSIKMTLPWLPQGSQFFAFVARNRGYWKTRGLNVEIARGFGSAAAIQTITQGQMQTGIIAAPSVLVGAAQDLDTRVVGIAGYDSTMGFLVLDESPVKSLKDLEGRKLGSTPQSAEVPFIDHFLTLSGVDPSKVSRVALQATALETTLMNKQVDAISVFATSNMPSLLVQGVKFRFYNFADVGIRLYSNCLTTSPTYLNDNKSVVEAWADGMNEGLKYSVTNFEDAVDIFVSEVPEVKMSSTGKAHTRYGAGLFLAAYLTPELREHGIGWGDPVSLKNQAELVMKYAVGQGAKRPDTAVIFSNAMAGKIKLTASEWELARKSASEFAPLLGIKL
ncbi:MAG TPA: ABC transporter substrate-binding protein [Bradyrhizobium sp.]|jgi:NitT/TauT family transport system substrate-binding protein|nr:ABC transporter substrate-binding protein [Bradyrhizobium sp.]